MGHKAEYLILRYINRKIRLKELFQRKLAAPDVINKNPFMYYKYAIIGGRNVNISSDLRMMRKSEEK